MDEREPKKTARILEFRKKKIEKPDIIDARTLPDQMEKMAQEILDYIHEHLKVKNIQEIPVGVMDDAEKFWSEKDKFELIEAANYFNQNKEEWLKKPAICIALANALGDMAIEEEMNTD